MQATPGDGTHLGSRFVDAVAYATAVHGGQCRKGGSIPYLAHLLAVASIVLEHGGSEDEAIAGLLHDAPEDAGGSDDGGSEERLADIRHRFGERVADIVLGCTDSTDERTSANSWERKKKAIEKTKTLTDPGIALVAMADKLHNVRSLLSDYRVVGPDLWSRFNVPGDQQLSYYEELVDAFGSGGSAERALELLAELGRTTRELVALAQAEGGTLPSAETGR